MEKLAVIAPDKGINKNLPAFLVEDRAWTDGNNVRFGAGYVEKAKGYNRFLNSPAAWQASTVYAIGDYAVPTTANGHVYKCTNINPSVAPATFSRASTAYDAAGNQFAANVPRFGPQGLPVEEGTTNLLPAGAENFVTGWTNPGTGGTATVTPGQPDPWGGNTAYRIQLGATQYNAKWRCGITRPDPHTDTVSLWMKVLSGNAGFAVAEGVDLKQATTSWQRFAATYPNAANTTTNLDIVTQNANDTLDVLVWGYPQTENKSYATSAIPPGQTRAGETLTVPTSGIINPNQGTVAISFYIDDLTKFKSSLRVLFHVPRATNYDGLSLYWQSDNTISFKTTDNAGNVSYARISANGLVQGMNIAICKWSISESKVFLNGVMGTPVSNPKLATAIHTIASIGWWNGSTGTGAAYWANVPISNLHISIIARDDAWLTANGTPGQAIVVDGFTTGYWPLTTDLSGTQGQLANRPESAWPTTAGSTVGDGIITWTEIGYNKLSGVLMSADNYYKYDGDAYLLAMTTTHCYRYEPGNNVFIDITGATPLAGTVNNPVVTENAQNLFVFTNGVDPVKYWDGNTSHNIADLPGLTDCEPDGSPVTSVRAKTLLYFKNFLILGGLSENSNPKPQRIRWSCLGDITKWKNVDGDINQSQAGWADIADDVSWVQAMRPLGDYVVVYKERAIQLINYVGGNEVWNKYSSFIGTGMISAKAIVDLGDEHIFVGNDNIYSFDGREPAIAGDAVAKEFFRVLDPNKYDLITGFYVEETPELWFSFVSTSSTDDYPDRCIAYNTDTKAWSWRDMPMLAYGYYNRRTDGTWDEDEDTWDSDNTEWDSSINLANAPINLCGDATGNIYVLEGNSFAGGAIGSSLTSKLFDFGRPELVKRLLRIQFMISREGPYYLPVYVGLTDNVDEEITWYGPYNMSLNNTGSPPWVDMDLSARYMAVRLGTVGADEPFRLTGYILYYELRGTS